MGGLKHLLFRILPIITLICFISYGIMHLYNDNSITYLTTEYIDKNTGQIYTNPTQEQKDNSYETYTYDLQSYANNIDQDIIKRATDRVIDFDTYQQVLDTYNNIWSDGYNTFDILNTITNTVLLTIDSVILIINCILVPLRVISGILLTGMSIVGINVNHNQGLIKGLNNILDKAVINLIPPTYGKESADEIKGSSYTIAQDPQSKYFDVFTTVVGGQLIYNYTNYNINVHFTSAGGGNYKNITTDYINESITTTPEMHFKIWYTDTSDNVILVYDNGWIYENSRHITIDPNTNLQGEDYNQLSKFLAENAQKVIE